MTERPSPAGVQAFPAGIVVTAVPHGRNEVEVTVPRDAPTADLVAVLTELAGDYPAFIDHYPENTNERSPIILVFRRPVAVADVLRRWRVSAEDAAGDTP